MGSKPGPGKPLAPWFKWSIPGFFSLCWDFLVNYVRGVMFYSEAQELGLWSEEEGGHGMLFLLNEHLQASTRGMDDLFGCAWDEGLYRERAAKSWLRGSGPATLLETSFIISWCPGFLL